jgi:phage terminase large subunit-like protein
MMRLPGMIRRQVLRLHTADDSLDAFSLEAIKAANPALNVFMNKKEVLAMQEDARRMPARQAEFENYVLNRRVVTDNPFVSRIAWDECSGEVADLHGVPLYGGLDLSSVADLTALVLIGKIDRVWHVKPTFWLPEVGLREKSQKDRTPYDLWHREGHLQAIRSVMSSWRSTCARCSTSIGSRSWASTAGT